MAIPKHTLAANVSVGENSTQYSHMYESYWSDRGAWANYGAYQVLKILDLFVYCSFVIMAQVNLFKSICS